MAKCRWEEEECWFPRVGGEFYCLTHLQESKWVFANAGDPPCTTTRLTPQEIRPMADEPIEPLDKVSLILDSLRALKEELDSHQYDLQDAGSAIEKIHEGIEDVENTVFTVTNAMDDSMERVMNIMSLIEQYSFKLVPMTTDEVTLETKIEGEGGGGI